MISINNGGGLIPGTKTITIERRSETVVTWLVLLNDGRERLVKAASLAELQARFGDALVSASRFM